MKQAIRLHGKFIDGPVACKIDENAWLPVRNRGRGGGVRLQQANRSRY